MLEPEFRHDGHIDITGDVTTGDPNDGVLTVKAARKARASILHQRESPQHRRARPSESRDAEQELRSKDGQDKPRRQGGQGGVDERGGLVRGAGQLRRQLLHVLLRQNGVVTAVAA